jgi:hypothetical protein
MCADIKSAKATAMQARVLGRVHTEIERQVQAVDEALRQLENAFMPDAQQQAELSPPWARACELRDEGLAVLDQASMPICHATDEASTGHHTRSKTIKEMVGALGTLKIQHSEMEQIEAQMAAATPDRDRALLVGQLHKLRQQRVQRPRILCSLGVSNRTGQGLHVLRRALAGLMEDTRLFAHVGARVPLNYSMLEHLAYEGREKLCPPSDPLLYRGDVQQATLDTTSRTISFDRNCTVRSRQQCPVGSKAYYELELKTAFGKYETAFQVRFGFAPAAFALQRGQRVGDTAGSWVVNNYKVKFNQGDREEYPCQWKQGDVIGLACDLQAMQMLVSVNGSFVAPNGHVFDLAPDAVRSGLFAAFSGELGTVGYNLGEVPFKYNPPAGDYCAFVKFGMNEVSAFVQHGD